MPGNHLYSKWSSLQFYSLCIPPFPSHSTDQVRSCHMPRILFGQEPALWVPGRSTLPHSFQLEGTCRSQGGFRSTLDRWKSQHAQSHCRSTYHCYYSSPHWSCRCSPHFYPFRPLESSTQGMCSHQSSVCSSWGIDRNAIQFPHSLRARIDHLHIPPNKGCISH